VFQARYRLSIAPERGYKFYSNPAIHSGHAQAGYRTNAAFSRELGNFTAFLL